MPGANYTNLTSIYGRRLGLQVLSTNQSGGRRPAELLAGPDAFRDPVTTSESTGTNLEAFGVSRITGSSADSSSVFTLDPPIPGVQKTLYFSSTGNTACYVKTKNGETFHTTIGSSHTTLKSTIGGAVVLTGLTTAVWGAPITSGTSSNAGGFTLTTST